jgi:hypothetical protein
LYLQISQIIRIKIHFIFTEDALAPYHSGEFSATFELGSAGFCLVASFWRNENYLGLRDELRVTRAEKRGFVEYLASINQIAAPLLCTGLRFRTRVAQMHGYEYVFMLCQPGNRLRNSRLSCFMPNGCEENNIQSETAHRG